MRYLAVAFATLAAAAASVAQSPAGTHRTGPPTTRAPTVSLHQAGSPVCTVTDHRATELSGLIATSTGYIAINDSQFDPNTIAIFYLNRTCKVTKVTHYPTAARDPEDLAVAPDGTLWVADIGDNLTAQTRRHTIALWRVPTSGPPVIYRLRYPDGPHDAEALLFTRDGVPIVVTKEPIGPAGLYQPTEPLVPGTPDGVPMRRVGEFSPTPTGENNFLGQLGEVLVTGAATTPDRRRVALRTYTAAYEWDVPDGDIVKAITGTVPRVTALPDEPQGESIAYTPDGATFLTVSDEAGSTTMRRYTPSTIAMAGAPPTSTATSVAAPKPAPPRVKIPIGYVVAAAVGGLGLFAVGMVGLRRGRRRPDD